MSFEVDINIFEVFSQLFDVLLRNFDLILITNLHFSGKLIPLFLYVLFNTSLCSGFIILVLVIFVYFKRNLHGIYK